MESAESKEEPRRCCGERQRENAGTLAHANPGPLLRPSPHQRATHYGAERRDLAARVLEQTRLELLAREQPLSGMEELKLFRLRAGEVLLPLPVKYAEIIAWGNDIDRLIDWTDSIDQQLSTLPALVVHVRKLSGRSASNAPSQKIRRRLS